MRRLLLVLLPLYACTDGESGRGLPDDTGADEGAADDSTDSAGPPDADHDGAEDAVDCDDTDATIHPGAAEVCDGIDQDCDGDPDEGVPNDGAGCQDPGYPTFPDPITSIQVTFATGTGTYDGTDDPVEVCLGAEVCAGMDVADWNDRESGQYEVYHIEGLSIPRASIDRFEVRTSDGGNMWVPVGFEVSLDGEPIYCQAPDSLPIGTGSGETADWTDPDGLGMHCTTAWPAMLTHGPLVGAVLPDAVHLWYRTDATRRVLLRVAATAAELATAAPVHYGYPSPGHDFADEVVIGGLTPESTWAWDLEIDGVRFGPWQFTTAPAAGTAGIRRIAFGSCTEEESQPAFGAVLAYDPDVYLFIGDNHYGNTADLGSLRQWYRWAHSRPLRADLLHQTAVLSTWDDHDYVGNNTDGSAEGKENALRAFDEYWANDGLGTNDVPGVFHRESWGDVDLVFLDDRYWRGLEDSITGDAQEAWLIDAVTTSTATFKIVASGSQWTAYGTSDSWAAFPEARARVLDAFSTVPGVVLLSGDVHRSEFRLHPDPVGYPIPEITSSGMAYTPMSFCGDEPDLLDCYDASHAWVTLDVDTLAPDPVLIATIRDESGPDMGSWTIHASELAP